MESNSNDMTRPVAVSDISSWVLFEKKDENIYCIGSIEKDKYIEVPERLKDAIMTCIKYFNGRYSISEIELALKEKHHIKVDIKALYDILCRASLIENGDKALAEKQELDMLSKSLLQIDLKRFYPLFSAIEKWIFPYGIYLSIAIIFLGLISFIKSISIFISPQNYQVNNSYVEGALSGILIGILSFILHELAHAATAYRYGLKPEKMQISLYLGMNFMVYLKIPGIYTVLPKKRIYIWIAGIYMNLFLSAVFMLLYNLTADGLKNIFVWASVLNLSFVFVNLSPLLPLDGYFILSTLLKRPNLRKGSFKEFKNWAYGRRHKFQGLMIVYFVLSGLMMAFLVGSQIYWVSIELMSRYRSSSGILEFIIDIKFIVITFITIIGLKVIPTLIKTLKLNNTK